jgi:hypothetical protein
MFRTLLCGIETKVLRRYLRFDFSKSTLANVDPKTDWVKNTEVSNAIFKRVSILNAHLVCLYTALSHRDVPSTKMVVTPSNMLHIITLDDVV